MLTAHKHLKQVNTIHHINGYDGPASARTIQHDGCGATQHPFLVGYLSLIIMLIKINKVYVPLL